MMFQRLFGPPNIPRLLERRKTASICRALTHADPQIRRAAAVALGQLGDGSAVADLITGLADQDKTVREASAAALTAIGPVAIPPLSEVLKRSCTSNKEDLVYQTLETLVPRSDMKGLALLVDCWRYGYSGVWIAASELLQKAGCRAVPVLIDALNQPEVQDFAAQVLGAIGDSSAVPALVAALAAFEEIGHYSLIFPHPCAEALGKILQSDAGPHLVKLLSHKEPHIRASILHIMGQTDDPSMVEAAIPYLTDKSARVRAEAVAVIGGSHDARYADSLLAALASEELVGDTDVLSALCLALADTGDHRAVQSLAHTATTCAIDKVVISAVDALGRLGDPAATEPLLALLENKQARLPSCTSYGHSKPIETILWALAKLADPRGLKAVVLCLNSQCSYDSGDRDDRVTVYPVAEAARSALIRVGEVAVDVLIEALNDRDRRSYSILRVLSAIQSDRVRFTLEAALRDNTGGPNDYSFRSYVAEALSEADATASSVQAVKQFIAEVRSAGARIPSSDVNTSDSIRHVLLTADKALRKLKERMP